MGILDNIVEWIATQVMNLLDLITGSVLGALGCDMSTFLRYFPAAETLYEIFVAIGVGFILLNLVWQLFRNFGLGLGLSAEDPVKLAIKSILFIFLALFADQISPLMFWCPRTNGYWSPDSLRHLHKQMLAAAGVDESVRFHDLRHTFSTLAIQSGVDAKTVAGMLGHYSAAFTLDTYTHVTEQMKRGAAEKIGVFMNASVNVQVNVVHSPSAVVRGDYESDLANCLNPSNSTDLDPTSQ